ncbi:hypothetical protein VIGAN_06164700 [Vigna angularis var. angularis]|uniref:Uncharacterized protein n=1 Tax=Vigna angularis var. angularis TaxID=157739 RepID=A0A0S3SC69_PHAAN|nr:hypothetical protein VIGAN_06164700 [Vigna angularis var. angularis]
MFCNHPDATKNIAAAGSAIIPCFCNYTVLLHVLQLPKCDKEHFQVLPPEDKAHSYDGFASTKGKMVLPRTVLMEQLKKGEQLALPELWAVQRLGLTDGPHHIVFPRIIKWPLVRLRSNKIEVLFKKKDICWEWFLREEDRQNLIIRAALQLDEGPIPQHGGHDLGMSWEEVVMKKIEDNQRKMVEMKKELKTLAAMVGDGKEETEQPSFFHEGGTCGVGVDVDIDVEHDDGDGDDVEGDDGGDDVEGDDGEGDYGDVDSEAHEGGKCLVTMICSYAGGCLEEEKDDVEGSLDVAPLVGIYSRQHRNEDVNLLNVNSNSLLN